MNAIEVLKDSHSRIQGIVHQAAKGLTEAQLEFRVDPEANSIGWLIWHLTRVQDDHVAGVAGTEQVWTANGWHGTFGLDIDDSRMGYGDSTSDVAKVKGVSAKKLLDYYDDVHAATSNYLDSLQDADLDDVVDKNWNPPGDSRESA